MSETNMYEQMIHRLFLIDKLNDELEKSEFENERKLDDKKKQFDKEVEELKKEVAEVKLIVNSLMKKVYSIGNKLKEKVDKKSLEKMNQIVDEFHFEEILHKNELERHYNKYAKFESKIK